MKHLQEAHYLRRERIYKDGKIVDWEYTFSDEPMEVETDDTVENSNFFGNQEPEIQDSQNLDSENHDEENQHFENPSDNIINNNKEKNNQTLLFHQETINQSAPEENFSTEFSTVENSDGLMEKMDRILREMKIYTEVVKQNIEYEDYAAWLQNYPKLFGKEHSMKVEELEEIVGMIVRTICSQSPCAEICGQVFPREVIKSTMLKVSRDSLDRTLDIIHKAGEIHNYERYFISVLFNETNGKHFNPHTEIANYEYEIRQMNRRYENY